MLFVTPRYASLGMRGAAMLLALCLCGCFGRTDVTPATGDGPAAVKSYKVRAGDTLYSIAWQADIDYRLLAAWNGIRPPYTIYPGQTLRFAAEPAAGADDYYVVQRGDTLYSVAAKKKIALSDLAVWNRLARPYLIYPGMRLRLAAPGAQPARRKKTSATADMHPRPAAGRKKIVWVWPVRGSIIKRFNDKTASKGIDIANTLGAKILAASAGKVVYQGNGLPGYGQLVIIKHDDEFLSAYAHCQHISVREGDVVKTGQEIARMGNTGADRVKLHFELRYQGHPVDPLHYLPKQ